MKAERAGFAPAVPPETGRVDHGESLRQGVERHLARGERIDRRAVDEEGPDFACAMTPDSPP